METWLCDHQFNITALFVFNTDKLTLSTLNSGLSIHHLTLEIEISFLTV